jgi:hypothetical protein
LTSIGTLLSPKDYSNPVSNWLLYHKKKKKEMLVE